MWCDAESSGMRRNRILNARVAETASSWSIEDAKGCVHFVLRGLVRDSKGESKYYQRPNECR